jgi:hypothetical protein
MVILVCFAGLLAEIYVPSWTCSMTCVSTQKWLLCMVEHMHNRELQAGVRGSTISKVERLMMNCMCRKVRNTPNFDLVLCMTLIIGRRLECGQLQY